MLFVYSFHVYYMYLVTRMTVMSIKHFQVRLCVLDVSSSLNRWWWNNWVVFAKSGHALNGLQRYIHRVQKSWSWMATNHVYCKQTSTNAGVDRLSTRKRLPAAGFIAVSSSPRHLQVSPAFFQQRRVLQLMVAAWLEQTARRTGTQAFCLKKKNSHLFTLNLDLRDRRLNLTSGWSHPACDFNVIVLKKAANFTFKGFPLEGFRIWSWSRCRQLFVCRSSCW